MTFYLVELLDKIYKFFKVKVFENKSNQTDLKLFSDNKSIQTDSIIAPILLENSTQTDSNLLDSQQDNDWDNLIWVNYNTNNIV